MDWKARHTCVFPGLHYTSCDFLFLVFQPVQHVGIFLKHLFVSLNVTINLFTLWFDETLRDSGHHNTVWPWNTDIWLWVYVSQALLILHMYCMCCCKELEHKQGRPTYNHQWIRGSQDTHTNTADLVRVSEEKCTNIDNNLRRDQNKCHDILKKVKVFLQMSAVALTLEVGGLKYNDHHSTKSLKKRGIGLCVWFNSWLEKEWLATDLNHLSVSLHHSLPDSRGFVRIPFKFTSHSGPHQNT